MTKRIRSLVYLEKQRLRKKTQLKERREKAIKILGSQCKECGTKDNLHFDHIDRESKTFAVSRASSDGKFWEELTKCQLLCAKCHREKSNREIAGESCYNSKLSHEQVKCILNRLYQKIPQKEIAKEFGVKPMQISRIKKGSQWRYMTDES